MISFWNNTSIIEKIYYNKINAIVEKIQCEMYNKQHGKYSVHVQFTQYCKIIFKLVDLG